MHISDTYTRHCKLYTNTSYLFYQIKHIKTQYKSIKSTSKYTWWQGQSEKIDEILFTYSVTVHNDIVLTKGKKAVPKKPVSIATGLSTFADYFIVIMAT